MTKRPNEKNERTKRDFLNYRKHAKQLFREDAGP